MAYSLANAILRRLFHILPESLPPDRRANCLAQANPSEPWGFSVLMPRFLAGLVRRPHPSLTLATITLPSCGPSTTNNRYSWSHRVLRQFLDLVGVCAALVSGVLVGLL